MQLIGSEKKLNLTQYVGKHVTVTGKALTPEEAAREAARRPDQQEAAETAAGTGGRPQRHLRYVRVEKIATTPYRGLRRDVRARTSTPATPLPTSSSVMGSGMGA